MKILCLYHSCGPQFVRQGWGNVLRATGHEFHFWDGKQKPLFDVFDELKPDLFITTTYDITPGAIQLLKENPQTKLALVGSNWGELDKTIDLDKYPIVVAQDKEKKMIERLVKETGREPIVFTHYHENFIEPTMGLWRTVGCRPISMMNAADVIDYCYGEPTEELKSDIAFVGGYWKYKAENLDDYILPLCNPIGKYRIKIFGNQAWPVPQFLGLVNTQTVRHIFASATICPSVSEPHSNAFGFDVIERPFKIISAGGFCISDDVLSLKRDIFTPEELPIASSPKEMHDMIDHFLAYPEERFSFMKAGQYKVYSEHTYFHRVAYLLKELGCDKESKEVEDVYYKHYCPVPIEGKVDASVAIIGDSGQCNMT
jgi:hypothetical protein